MHFDWDQKKNEKLKAERNITFEQVVIAMSGDGFVDEIKNPSDNFPHQRAYVVRVHGYIYYVPFVVKEGGGVFLKTIIPSRKIRKKYQL